MDSCSFWIKYISGCNFDLIAVTPLLATQLNTRVCPSPEKEPSLRTNEARSNKQTKSPSLLPKYYFLYMLYISLSSTPEKKSNNNDLQRQRNKFKRIVCFFFRTLILYLYTARFLHSEQHGKRLSNRQNLCCKTSPQKK